MRRALGVTFTLIALSVGTLSAMAEVDGWIWKQGAGPSQAIKGKIRWRGASKEYVIRTDQIQVNVRLNEVGGMRIAKPAGLDAALQKVASGSYAAPIPVLERIVADYTMLQHDIAAGAALARAYLGTNKSKDAMRLCEKIKENKPPEMITRALESAYWEALLQEDAAAKLRIALDEAIKTGPRDVAAEAQLKRGDLDLKKDDPKGALIDGYLRTIVLYQDVKEVQAEALFKAYQCFDKLGQNSAKDNMRKRLLADFPQSKFARDLR